MNDTKIIEVLDNAIRKAHGEGWNYVDLSIEDAREILESLRRCEPKVMTWDEVLEFAEFSDVGYSEKTPCYIEYFKSDPCYIKWGDAETIYNWVNIYITRDERRRLYNRNGKGGWRCWSSRPTKEQMKNTKWKENSDVETS